MAIFSSISFLNWKKKETDGQFNSNLKFAMEMYLKTKYLVSTIDFSADRVEVFKKLAQTLITVTLNLTAIAISFSVNLAISSFTMASSLVIGMWLAITSFCEGVVASIINNPNQYRTTKSYCISRDMDKFSLSIAPPYNCYSSCGVLSHCKPFDYDIPALNKNLCQNPQFAWSIQEMLKSLEIDLQQFAPLKATDQKSFVNKTYKQLLKASHPDKSNPRIDEFYEQYLHLNLVEEIELCKQADKDFLKKKHQEIIFTSRMLLGVIDIPESNALIKSVHERTLTQEEMDSLLDFKVPLSIKENVINPNNT